MLYLTEVTENFKKDGTKQILHTYTVNTSHFLADHSSTATPQSSLLSRPHIIKPLHISNMNSVFKVISVQVLKNPLDDI
jgi:hypothetical protein